MRIPATDYVEGGGASDAIAFAHELKSAGADFVDVSGGGVSPAQKIPVGPLSGGVRRGDPRETGLITMAVGMIDEPHQATASSRRPSDLVALARAFLRNPRWVWDAADLLGGEGSAHPIPARPHRRRLGRRAAPLRRIGFTSPNIPPPSRERLERGVCNCTERKRDYASPHEAGRSIMAPAARPSSDSSARGGG